MNLAGSFGGKVEDRAEKLVPRISNPRGKQEALDQRRGQELGKPRTSWEAKFKINQGAWCRIKPLDKERK